MTTNYFNTTTSSQTNLSRLLLRGFQTVASGVVPRGLPRLGWVSRRLLVGQGVKEVQFKDRFIFCCDSDSYHSLMFAYGIENRYTDRLLARLLQDDDVFLDVGGHIGMVTLLACSQGKRLQAHCFEPDSRTFAWLSKNVTLNPFNIKLNACAVGAEKGRAEINLSTVSGWSTLVNEPTNGYSFMQKETTATVEVITLDDYCAEQQIRPALIKIDVEGFEEQVILGGQKTFESVRPYVIIELNPSRLEAGGSSARQVIERLHTHGYRLYHVNPRKAKKFGPRPTWQNLPELYASDVPFNSFMDALAVPMTRWES